MNLPHDDLAQDIQPILTIVQRNLTPENWVDLLPEAQERTLQEVIDLLDHLPTHVYQDLMAKLEPLTQQSPADLHTQIQSILAQRHIEQEHHDIQCFHPIASPQSPSPQSPSPQSPTPLKPLKPLNQTAPLNLFIRQPFTESGQDQQRIIQGVLDLFSQVHEQHQPLNVLTGLDAQNQATFRQSFEQRTGLCFTPSNFRRHRLQLLDQADAMVVVRTSLSESGAFEIAYNTFAGQRLPMFFAVWKQAPIKTTLLRELDELCQATYVTFDQPDELLAPLLEFLTTVSQQGYTAWGSDRQAA